MNNRKGQWIILSGLILALGLISMVVLLNQAMSAGYKVSQAETDFPGHEITEIYEETVRTSKLVHATGADFNNSMDSFAENVSKIYAAHGTFVEINMYNTSSNIANLSIHYYDGKVNFMLGNFTPDGTKRKIQL